MNGCLWECHHTDIESKYDLFELQVYIQLRDACVQWISCSPPALAHHLPVAKRVEGRRHHLTPRSGYVYQGAISTPGLWGVDGMNYRWRY